MATVKTLCLGLMVIAKEQFQLDVIYIYIYILAR